MTVSPEQISIESVVKLISGGFPPTTKNKGEHARSGEKNPPPPYPACKTYSPGDNGVIMNEADKFPTSIWLLFTSESCHRFGLDPPSTNDRLIGDPDKKHVFVVLRHCPLNESGIPINMMVIHIICSLNACLNIFGEIKQKIRIYYFYQYVIRCIL